MSDATIVTVVTAACGLVATMFGGVITVLLARMKKVADVATTLEESNEQNSAKLNSVGIVTAANHQLANNQFLIQLRLNMMVTRRLAQVTKTPEDIELAAAAQELYEAHAASQADLDQASEVNKAVEQLQTPK